MNNDNVIQDWAFWSFLALAAVCWAVAWYQEIRARRSK